MDHQVMGFQLIDEVSPKLANIGEDVVQPGQISLNSENTNRGIMRADPAVIKEGRPIQESMTPLRRFEASAQHHVPLVTPRTIDARILPPPGSTPYTVRYVPPGTTTPSRIVSRVNRQASHELPVMVETLPMTRSETTPTMLAQPNGGVRVQSRLDNHRGRVVFNSSGTTHATSRPARVTGRTSNNRVGPQDGRPTEDTVENMRLQQPLDNKVTNVTRSNEAMARVPRVSEAGTLYAPGIVAE